MGSLMRGPGLVGLSFAVVLVIATPLLAGQAGARVTPSRTHVAPFAMDARTAFEGCGCGGAFIVSVHPTANHTSGAIHLALQGSHGHPGCANYCTHAEAEGGFPFWFRAQLSGIQNVSANWTVSWNASASCLKCPSNSPTASLAHVGVGVWVERWPHRATITPGVDWWGSSYSVSDLSGSHGRNSSSGTLTVTVTVQANLTAGQEYLMFTAAEGSIIVYPTPVPGSTALASIDLARAGNGAVLNWATTP